LSLFKFGIEAVADQPATTRQAVDRALGGAGKVDGLTMA
jgi:hypothetical protein